MNKKLYLAALLLLLALLSPGQPGWADVAPPEFSPGSSLEPGESITQVQMMSEEVLLEVEKGEPPSQDDPRGRSQNGIYGRVEAVFVMRNQGEAKESFDVWFPLGAPDGWGDVSRVGNFQAWVDDVPAEIGEAKRPGKWESMVPWATWPVTFPPGQEVILRVSYDLLAEGYAPYGSFGYVLETGAGWWGPIGQGTITFRLPYEANESNAALPADVEVAGTDVVWRFSDLEPTPKDNIRLTVMSPGVWRGILAARQEAAANPDSAEAQLNLARALEKGLSIKYGLIPIANSEELAEEAQAAYLRAVELDPENLDPMLDYLDLEVGLAGPVEPVSEAACPVLERALELAPKDQEVTRLRDYITGTGACQQALPPTMTPRPTHPPTATRQPTLIPSPTDTVTVTSTSIPPTATPTPVPSLTPSPEPVAAATDVPPTSPPAAATPKPESGGGDGICPGSLALGLVPLALLIYRRRPRRRK